MDKSCGLRISILRTAKFEFSNLWVVASADMTDAGYSVRARGLLVLHDAEDMHKRVKFPY